MPNDEYSPEYATASDDETTTPEGETKADRFKRLATSRVKKVLTAMDILSNCSSRTTYEYTPEQVEKLFSYLDKGIEDLRLAFGTVKAKEKNSVTL